MLYPNRNPLHLIFFFFFVLGFLCFAYILGVDKSLAHKTLCFKDISCFLIHGCPTDMQGYLTVDIKVTRIFFFFLYLSLHSSKWLLQNKNVSLGYTYTPQLGDIILSAPNHLNSLAATTLPHANRGCGWLLVETVFIKHINLFERC